MSGLRWSKYDLVTTKILPTDCSLSIGAIGAGMSNPVDCLRFLTDSLKSESEMTHHGDHDDDSVGTEPRQGVAGHLSDGGHQEENVDEDHHAGHGVEADLDVGISDSSDVAG